MSRIDEIKERMSACTDTYVDNAEFIVDMQYLLTKLEQVERALELIANNGDDRPDAYYVLNMVDNALEQLRKD